MKKTFSFVIILSVVFCSTCQIPPPSEGSLFDEEISLFPEAVNYDLNIDVDYEGERIEATCTLAVRNPGNAPLALVPFNLYRLMKVSSIIDEAGVTPEFSQRVLTFEDWAEFQVNHVRVKLDPPLPPGKKKFLEIHYGGPLLGYSEAMAYVKDHVSRDITVLRTDSLVFPSIGIPSWKKNRALGLGRYDHKAEVTVPAPLTVANGGNLIAEDTQEGIATYLYESKVPSWRIDLIAAEYEIHEDEEDRFKIFAFSEDRSGAEALLDSLVKTLDLYTEWFGPLKVFEGLTVIEVPDGYGSQADVATIIQEAAAFKDKSDHYTFYHELSHLWNVEGKDPLPPRFEGEGLGMFLQHLVQEKLENKPAALENAVKVSLERMKNYFTEHPEARDVPMIAYGENNLTDLSYRMGQIMYFILYRILGERQLLAIVGTFYQDKYETGATSEEFITHFKDRSEVDLDRVFEEWILTPAAAKLLLSGISLPNLVNRYK